MGCVKTGCRMFPKAYFEAWSNDADFPRGSHKTLKSSITFEDNVTVEDIFAVGWKDKTTKKLVYTRGLTSVMGKATPYRHTGIRFLVIQK
jgi:hypothetical protein